MGRLSPDEIPSGATVAIDTVGWIYLLERHPDHYPAARRFFSRVEAGEVQGVISTLVITELLVPAYRAGEARRAAELVRVLQNFPHLQVVDLNAGIAARAAEVRARYGFRTPDAIHCATALSTGCDAFLTNDAALLRAAEQLPVFLFTPPR